VFDRLTVLASPPAPSLFSFHPIPVHSLSTFPPLNLAIFFLCHTHSLPSLLYFDSLILSLLSYLSVSLSRYLFIHLLLVPFLAGSFSLPLLLLELFLQFILSLSSYLNHSPFIYIFLYPIFTLFRHLYTSSHLFFPSTYPYLA
jgi:hypothetical protein